MSSKDLSQVSLELDPGRICFGLSRIGYTPATALCDILDNSVRAKAANIRIQIIKAREDLNDNKKNNVKEYVVIDDGIGMNDSNMIEALKLGSSEHNYGENSLSKFGLGLKSASFSQGEELHLISSPGNGQEFRKYVVSMPEIRKHKKYFATLTPLNKSDLDLISSYLGSGKGTIIRVVDVRLTNHPSVKKTIEELTNKVGVIYYYFMKEDGIKIWINDSLVEPFDVLFVDEANQNGNLDENDWDAKTVKWIEKPTEITLDAPDEGENVKAIIEVTQLPYPPIFDLDERGKQKQIRDKYRIAAGNYGYYVYRNKRLISWAESFGGIIPQDQDYYAFRGRILIDESADDSFNIDVKKSTITLSDEASTEISDRSDQYKRKSKRGWERGASLKNEVLGKDTNLTANEIVASFEPPELLPGEPVGSPAIELERTKRGEEMEKEMQKRIRENTVRHKSDAEGREIDAAEIDNADIESFLKEDANPAASKIYKVSQVDDNALWAPYYDTDHGNCVRINKLHRFSRLIFDDNSENPDLQIMFQLLLLQLSEAEVYAQKNLLSVDRKDVQRVIAEYRRITSECLASMCRDLEGKLPPIKR
jgi:hypothetical protein